MPLQRVEVRIFTPARLPPVQARRLQTAFNTTFLARPQVTRWRIAGGDAHPKLFSAHDAHYGGNLVDGARILHLFGDVATELLIRMDGDEGLFAAYDSVEFLAPVRAGDYIEAEGRIESVDSSRTEITLTDGTKAGSAAEGRVHTRSTRRGHEHSRKLQG